MELTYGYLNTRSVRGSARRTIVAGGSHDCEPRFANQLHIGMFSIKSRISRDYYTGKKSSGLLLDTAIRELPPRKQP